MSTDQGASAEADRAATPSEPSQSSVVSGVAGIPCAFTPGPWFVHDHREMNGCWWIGPGQFDTVAEARMGHADLPGDELSNARLIAAAPELYEALTILRREIADTEEHGDGAAEDYCTVCQAIERADAALAKVRGQ